MSQSQKRKRAESKPASGLAKLDHVVLNCIKSKGDQAILDQNIGKETKLPIAVVKNCIKTLQAFTLIKQIPHAQFKGKYYIAAEIMPADNVTGGIWYLDGQLDTEFIDQLKDVCWKIIKKLKVATAEGVYDVFKKSGLTNYKCTSQQITEVLRLLVLDNMVLEVKSTGLAEYQSIPIGNVCYRCSVQNLDQGLKLGAMASVPCGVCPQISNCTPDGLISPSSCVYYTEWLDF